MIKRLWNYKIAANLELFVVIEDLSSGKTLYEGEMMLCPSAFDNLCVFEILECVESSREVKPDYFFIVYEYPYGED